VAAKSGRSCGKMLKGRFCFDATLNVEGGLGLWGQLPSSYHWGCWRSGTSFGQLAADG